MKTPLLNFPLLLINGLWLGLIVGLVVSPLVGCLLKNRIFEIYTFTPILILIIFGLYKLQIKQIHLLAFNIIAGILTLYSTKIINTTPLYVIATYCHTLRPYEGNDAGALFFLGTIYLIFLLLQYGLRLIVLKIKNRP